jgi:DNA glycosylase AlkZ-like
MAFSLSDDQVRLLRLRAQRLTPGPGDGVSDIALLVKELCGIQAQDARAATLALRVRSAGLVAADIERARVQERTIIRTWGQRGTLHLLAAEDLGWLLPLFGPVFIAGGRRRRAELGLDEETCARGIRVMRDVLASQGPLTRAEIVEQLTIHGLHIEGQARPHLLYRAALEGVICMGPDRGTEPTYVLISDWVQQGHVLSQEAAYAELARRYLGTYGPATPGDMAAWSGLPISRIRPAWRNVMDQLIEVEIGGSAAWMFKTCAAWLDEPPMADPVVCLLPGFDIYLLGYQKRDLAVPQQHAKRINVGGGILHPALLVDGGVVGTWKSLRKKKHLNVIVEPFDQLAPEVYPGLEAEVADLARFLEVEASLQVTASQ